jgi:DNA-binding response OmpR family regulator
MAEVKDELDAYRANEREATAPLSETYVAVKRRFGLVPAGARILVELLDNAGRVVRNARIDRLAAKGDDVTSNVGGVQLCRLRAALRPYGLTIETIWGEGVLLDAQNAARIRDLTAPDRHA